MLGVRASDRHITVYNGLLKHLKYGDLVLADRGFDIIDDLAMIGASLANPPFIKGKPQLSQQEVEFPDSSPVLESTWKEP